MVDFRFVSAAGDTLHLVGNPLFTITNIDGLTAATASISSNTIYGVDGDTVTNIQGQPRTIVIDLRVKDGVSVDDAKKEILRVVKYKTNCTLFWSQSDWTRQISGFVESIEMPRFSNAVAMQISLHCPVGYWMDTEYTVQSISSFVDLHKFSLAFPEAGVPFGRYRNDQTRTVVNGGDVAVGIVCDIIAHGGGVTNPKIYDKNRDFFGVDVAMDAGDVLSFSTVRGAKTVSLNGENVIGKLAVGSRWIVLDTGANEFSLSVESGNLADAYYSIRYRQLYI